MDQMLKTPPQSEEDAQMQQELAQMRPELQKLLIEAKTMNENIVLLTEEDEEKIDRYWKYKSTDVRELAASNYLKKGIQERFIKRKSIEAFKDQCITGKPMYFVDTAPDEKYPTFEQI